FFSSRRRHTRCYRDWSSDVCSSDLGVMLDLVRGFFVLLTAYIAWRGRLQLWHLYGMTLITGTGSAMYWAAVNALVQEVIPPSQRSEERRVGKECGAGGWGGE